MARIVKVNKRKKVRLEGFAGIVFALAIISMIFSNLFLRNANASLMMKIQDVNNEWETLKNANRSLSIEIQTLQNKERIFTMAEEAGLTQNTTNVMSLGGE